MQYSEINSFLLFFGYPRSGHSFLGQCINSRKDAVVSHESSFLHSLLYENDITFGQIVDDIVSVNDHFCNNLNYIWESYDYKIIPEAQVSHDVVQCVGNKKGAGTTQLLLNYPFLLQRLRSIVSVDIKFIHYVRNPIDTISTMTYRQNASLAKVVSIFKNIVKANADIMSTLLERKEYIVIYHDDFIENPRRELHRVSQFLSLEKDDEWERRCEDKCYRKESQSRFKALWTVNDVQSVVDICNSYNVFNRYIDFSCSFLRDVKSGAFAPRKDVVQWNSIRSDIVNAETDESIYEGVLFALGPLADYSQINFLIMYVVTKLKDLRLAQILTEKALRLNPSSNLSCQLLALVTYLKGEPEKALKLLEKSADISPRAFNTKELSLSRQLLSMGRFDEAEKYCKEALRLFPNSAAPLFVLSQIYSRQGDNGKAMEVIRYAIELQDDDYRLYNQLGVLCKEVGNLEKAEGAFRKSIQLNPRASSSHIQLSHVYAQQSNYKKAIEVIDNAITIIHDDYDLYSCLGSLCMDNNDGLRAKESFLKAAQLDRENPLPHFHLSRIYEKERDFKSAICEIKCSIELKENVFSFYNQLGLLSIKSGDLASAEKAFCKAVQLNSRVHSPHVSLSHVYARQGNNKKALDEIQCAIALKHDDHASYNHLGRILLRIGDLEKSEEAFCKAIQLNERVSSPHIQLSHVYEKQGDIVRAIQKMRDAILWKEDDKGLYTRLADLLKHNGEILKANEMYAKVLAIDSLSD
ncbi:tetratricopeptide repeat protein [Desulfovibrio inopinatus]|uniref:tetratricopeptide repeat protein n=1 Tax=Desulfovibrio inopinatus TaxID=102109 RepID=UPI00040FEDE4|nr:tetratricopeptide repeat protein [Desulfovibrio inopinatus]